MIRMPRLIRKPLALVGVSVCCGALLYAVANEPTYGVVDAPAHTETSAAGSVTAGTYYTRNAYHDAHTPNMVTVTLADYRSFDTLGETTVVFAGAVCVMLLLRRKRSRKGDA